MEQETSVRPPLFSRQALIRLAIPLVIEQLLLMTVGMADTVMVTTAGEAAVSGVSLVDNINLLLIQVFAALSTGGAVVVSQYLGRQDREGARIAARQLIYAVVAASTALMALALIFRQHILALLFGHIDAQVMDSALVYFLITAMAYPFMSLYNAGAALFRSMGNSKVSMFNSLLVNVINISVNAVLIFGFGMGAAGAAIGTLASRIVAAVLMLVLLHRPENPVNIQGLSHFEFRWDMVRRILTIGIPTGLENGMFQVGKLLVLNLITTFGTAAITANAIANSIAGVVNVPGQALGLALITVVGQSMGAREPGQAVSYTKKLITVCYVAMGSMCLVLFFTAGPVVGLFHLSPQAAEMAAEVLRWCAAFQIFLWPLAFCLPNALRAAGDAVFTMLVSLLSMFIFRIGASYLLASPWGLGLALLGVWIAMIIDWGVRALVFTIRFARGRWKRIQLI
ncbi:MATE family efflux transporter [Oscillospiraceae bacterium]|nr:MATE family efflux transporter [Oscillospiraceae bacterium]BDF75402.1 MATE family efflux transporter [Oscillospiraceae bacterium]